MGLGRWVIGAGICTALGWTACGGDSFTGGSGTGGNASGGASGSGANGGDAGNGGSAGTGTAGTNSAGTGNGGNGAGGNGAGGNAGAGGIPAEYESCSGPGQCVLVPSNCCGYCSQPRLEDFFAIHHDFESSFYAERCGGAIECPSCETVMPGNFTAVCRAGRCERVNVYEDDKLVGCDGNADCRLRWGAQCCEPCAPTPDQLIAVANSAIEQNQCGGGVPCPECPTPAYPSDASAQCIDRRCAIVYAN